MKVASKANPETLKKIEELKAQWKNFPKQEKLFDKLKTIWPDDGPLHPHLFHLFHETKFHANAEQLGGNETYFKLMRSNEKGGFSFNEMAHIFNYIENLSLKKVDDSVFSGDFLEVFEFTYLESAKFWNNQVDHWKKEIEEEQNAIAKEIEVLVNELNQANKKLSRKERKQPNQQ